MAVFFGRMNISLGKQLEKLVEEQVKSGVYQNNSEVVRDALRHMFLEEDSDDTELLAQSLRAAKNSPRKRYVRGEFQKLVARAVAAKGRQAKAA
jgi:antitoxin ParD1/3/4